MAAARFARRREQWSGGVRKFGHLEFTQGDARELFVAELDADFERLAAVSERIDVEVEVSRTIANLFVMPVMHACRETESAQAAVRSRCEGYCACCGAWPAYSEICGVARERRLCCGRCGTSWAHEVLSCTYCGTHDHKVLSTLDVESDQLRGGIEVCERSRGYLRQCCSLTHSGPMDVLLRDLGSVELDVAATNRSYVRPRGVGRTGTVLPLD
jgi:FdhE protein